MNGQGPYYELNFRLILNHHCSNHDTLFSKEEQSLVDRIISLPTAPFRLWARLYQRKKGWLRVSKLKVVVTCSMSLTNCAVSGDIGSPGLCPAPTQARSCSDTGTTPERVKPYNWQVDDISEALNILTVAELTSIRRHLRVPDVNCKGKSSLVDRLLDHARKQVSRTCPFGSDCQLSALLLVTVSRCSASKCTGLLAGWFNGLTVMLMLLSCIRLDDTVVEVVSQLGVYDIV